MKDMGQADYISHKWRIWGFTEYEWFSENLSICRYARTKSVYLEYFVILVYDVLRESSNFETPCNDC